MYKRDDLLQNNWHCQLLYIYPVATSCELVNADNHSSQSQLRRLSDFQLSSQREVQHPLALPKQLLVADGVEGPWRSPREKGYERLADQTGRPDQESLPNDSPFFRTMSRLDCI